MADENNQAITISRNGRARKPRQMYTPSKGLQGGGVKHTAKFVMNKSKALNKKISSTYKRT